MKKNNCWECPFHGEVTGSAHIRCNFLGPENDGPFLALAILGQKPEIKADGESILEIDAYGFKSGWALWPAKFDPTWITCKLPVTVQTVMNERDSD